MRALTFAGDPRVRLALALVGLVVTVGCGSSGGGNDDPDATTDVPLDMGDDAGPDVPMDPDGTPPPDVTPPPPDVTPPPPDVTPPPPDVTPPPPDVTPDVTPPPPPPPPPRSLLQLLTGQSTWDVAAANAFAEDSDGILRHLAVVSSGQELGWIREIIYFAPGNLWLGASRNSAGDWEWVTGEPFNITAWQAGEPSGGGEDVLEMWSAAVAPMRPGNWNDTVRDNTLNNGAIIEYPRLAESVRTNPSTGHAYLVARQETERWDDAAALSNLFWYNGVRGHLATITSEAEQQYLRDTFGDGLSQLWAGGYQEANDAAYSEPAGGWRWVTGEPFAYTNWTAGEPNDDRGREAWLSLTGPGAWNDNVEQWNYDPANRGLLIEFTPEVPVRHVAQLDNPTWFRSVGGYNTLTRGDDGAFGSRGWVFYGARSATAGDRSFFDRADPMTYVSGDARTISSLPSWLTVRNNGQDFVLSAPAFPTLDDPRQPIAEEVTVDIRAGAALRNNVGRGTYASVADLVFTAGAPSVVRVGVFAPGVGEDAMSGIRIVSQRTGQAVGMVRRGAPTFYAQLFDLTVPAAGGTYTIEIAKGDGGSNPNVMYLGLTVD